MNANIIFPNYMEDKEYLQLVRLKLSVISPPPPPPPPPPQPFVLFSPPPSSSYLASAAGRNVAGPTRPSRTRKSPANILRQGKSPTVPPPYPWATNERAKVRSLKDLLSSGIDKIKGDVQCKRCGREYPIEFDLQEKFHEVDAFFTNNVENMHDRAPSSWMSPRFLSCKFCGQNNCVKPVLGEKKRSINWLFLFLGQMLGFCKLAELKYFCKHTKHHRTGAKDRVLYLTYAGLRKQLESA